MPTWSAPLSLRGKAGSQLRFGYGPPDASIGQDGDTYFNAQSRSLVGPKADGAWPDDEVSLVGAAGGIGDAGTIIYAAQGAPDDVQGRDGDFFLDTTETVYGFYGPKRDGMWGNAVSLIGPVGAVGARGPRGAAGSDGATILQGMGPPSDQGKPGDYYYDSRDSVLYGPRTSDINQPWPVQGFNLLGPQGPIGPQGPGGMMGADGKTLRSGIGDPSDALGDDGDYYFNADNGRLVGPKAKGTWPLPGFLLKGPPGDQGPVGQTGQQGIQGPGILSGSGRPRDDFGTLGSFYIDGQNYVLYGPKTNDPNTPWSMFRNIVGPRGADGAASTVPGPAGPTGSVGAQGLSVRSGQGAPANTLGADGDLYVDLAGGPDLYGPKANGAWPATFISLVGKMGPMGPASTVPGPMGAMGYSVQSGQGDPPSSLGQNGDLYVDTLNGRLYGAKSQNAWPTTYTSLLGATGAKGDQGVAGAPGSILRYGMGAPGTGTTSNNGDFYIDQTNSRLYGPKIGGTWSSTFVSLVGPTGLTGPQGPPGPAGTNAVLPNDLTANSLVVAPVSGDANPVQVQLRSATGQVFLVDAQGNVTANGSLTANGASLGATTTSSLNATGTVTMASSTTTGSANAARFIATNSGSGSSPMLQFTATGQGTPYTSGVYSENNYGQMYESVAGYTARSIIYSNTNPRDNGAGYLTHNWFSTTGTSQPAYRFYTGNGLALQITGNQAATFGAALTVAGPTTSAGLSLSSGGVTFPDGSTLTTATQAAQATYVATSAGTAAAPAHAYAGAAKGAGLYFDANGNSLLSVNGSKSLYSTAAAGAAAGANGWAIASTLGAGSALLALYGASSATVPVAQVDGAGTASFANVTLATSGKLTFGDGTSMTTAATGTGGGGAAGPAGSQVRYGTGAPSTTNPSVQNDGDSYIDQQQSMLYGPRANGVWPNTPISLIGPSGPQGPTGATGPASTATRNLIYAGTYWNQSVAANTPYAMNECVQAQNNGANGVTPAVIGMLRAGSITGYSFNQVGPVSGSFTLTVQKNGTTVATFANVGSGITSTKPFTGTVAAGTFPFAAGDGLTLSVQTTGSGNLQSIGYLEITTN